MDWTNLPGDQPPGVLRADLSREIHDDLVGASVRLPRVATLSCGPFQIAVRANPDSVGIVNNITEVSSGGAMFNGFFLVVSAPADFSDRIRFRTLLYPDLNARTFVREDNAWSDITNPKRTYLAGGTSDTYRDLYLGFDPSVQREAFFDSTYISHVPWSAFVTRSIYQNDGDYPEGRYRISFTTPYEMEWPTGSCQFRLPDLKFTYREG